MTPGFSRRVFRFRPSARRQPSHAHGQGRQRALIHRPGAAATGVGSQLPHRVAHDPLEPALYRFISPRDLRDQGRKRAPALDIQAVLQTQVPAQKDFDPLASRNALSRRRQALAGLGRRMLQRLGQERLLGIKVSVKSARSEARLCHHLVHARGVISLPPEYSPRGPEDPRPRFLLLISRVAHTAPSRESRHKGFKSPIVAGERPRSGLYYARNSSQVECRVVGIGKMMLTAEGQNESGAFVMNDLPRKLPIWPGAPAASAPKQHVLQRRGPDCAIAAAATIAGVTYDEAASVASDLMRVPSRSFSRPIFFAVLGVSLFSTSRADEPGIGSPRKIRLESGRVVEFAIPFDRNALRESVRVGNSLIALTASGALLRFRLTSGPAGSRAHRYRGNPMPVSW